MKEIRPGHPYGSTGGRQAVALLVVGLLLVALDAIGAATGARSEPDGESFVMPGSAGRFREPWSRFNRSCYDAELVMDDFAASLRDEVGPGNLVDGWLVTVSMAMQPHVAGVWMRPSP